MPRSIRRASSRLRPRLKRRCANRRSGSRVAILSASFAHPVVASGVQGMLAAGLNRPESTLGLRHRHQKKAPMQTQISISAAVLVLLALMVAPARAHDETAY